MPGDEASDWMITLMFGSHNLGLGLDSNILWVLGNMSSGILHIIGGSLLLYHAVVKEEIQHVFHLSLLQMTIVTYFMIFVVITGFTASLLNVA